jgi:hypothetical protein
MHTRTLEPLHLSAAVGQRHLKKERLQADLVVVGGGMAGTCCAITAARAGASVVLIQDRPVLGGNASSEVRVKIAGAAGGANRWAREGGVIDDILIENAHRNPEGNPVLFDHIVLEQAAQEPNITLLLNTAALDVEKPRERIRAVRAFCSQNSTIYDVTAKFVCDASGDGIVAYLAGASFRMGAEARDEFDESFAPTIDYGTLMGDTILLQTKDVGRPVRFVPPSYALEDITVLPKYKMLDTDVDAGRAFHWWAEFGGRLDTVHDSEKIKWEIWRLVLGVWNHLKNSGQFPAAESLTLEWLGQIPGKRESRRFEGLYMLNQNDIIDQVEHFDAVAYGGFPIDFHPGDGAYSEWEEDYLGARAYATPGTYQIPFRCLVSRDVPNLFMSGRLISVSHVALGTTRQMATCSLAGQAVGMAAAICASEGIDPTDLLAEQRIEDLQLRLLKSGHHIPGVRLRDPMDLVQNATIAASSELVLTELPADGPPVTLDKSMSQLLPVTAGPLPALTFTVDVRRETTLRLEVKLPRSSKTHLPDVLLAENEIHLVPGSAQRVTIIPDVEIECASYVHYILVANDAVSVKSSSVRVTGLLSVSHFRTVGGDGGIDSKLDWRPALEYWRPDAPGGQNLAISVDPPLVAFGPDLISNGFARPTTNTNAWVAAPEDDVPTITLRWPARQLVRRLDITFDGDFDRYLQSTAVKSEPANPFGVAQYQVVTGEEVAVSVAENCRPRRTHVFDPPLDSEQIKLRILETVGEAPAAVFEIRAYGQNEPTTEC